MLCLRALQPTGAPRGRRNAAPRSRQPYNGGGAGRGTANGSTTTAARTPGVSARNQLLTIWKWGSLLRHKQSCMASSAVFYLRQQSRVIYMVLNLHGSWSRRVFLSCRTSQAVEIFLFSRSAYGQHAPVFVLRTRSVLRRHSSYLPRLLSVAFLD